jgi:hypothetical protein
MSDTDHTSLEPVVVRLGTGLRIAGRHETVVELITSTDPTGQSVTMVSKGSDPVPPMVVVTIGTVVIIGQQAYEVWLIKSVENANGWGSTVWCVDLMMATEKREVIHASRAHVRTQLGMEQYMSKSEKLIDQGLEDTR